MSTIKAEWTNADALDLQPTCNQLATDVISRQAAIDALCTPHGILYPIRTIEELPSAQPKLNKEKISNLLWNEYHEMSSHLSTEGVVARRYFCKELWKELFGEEETPVWMTW